MGSPMETIPAAWAKDRPGEIVRFGLLDHDGAQINERDVDMDDRDRYVGSAGFELYDGANVILAMTVVVQPPDVKGYDGIPLDLDQLGGAIADLKRYEEALVAGNAGD
jgi:hypothetical protein